MIEVDQTEYEILTCPMDIIGDMGEFEFKQWLKLDFYCNSSVGYDEKLLLGVYDKINSVEGFEEKELIVLNLLSSVTL